MNELTLLDKSNYLRGLLIVIKKDNRVAPQEKEMINGFCKQLGFDVTFCRNAVESLLENEYISDDPPKFSDPEIARYFIEDGFRVAASDNDIDPREILFLQNVALNNSLEKDWFENVTEDWKSRALSGDRSGGFIINTGESIV